MYTFEELCLQRSKNVPPQKISIIIAIPVCSYSKNIRYSIQTSYLEVGEVGAGRARVLGRPLFLLSLVLHLPLVVPIPASTSPAPSPCSRHCWYTVEMVEQSQSENMCMHALAGGVSESSRGAGGGGGRSGDHNIDRLPPACLRRLQNVPHPLHRSPAPRRRVPASVQINMNIRSTHRIRFLV